MNLLELVREELIKEGHNCTRVTRDDTFDLRAIDPPHNIIGTLSLYKQTRLSVDTWYKRIRNIDLDLTDPTSIPRLLECLAHILC